jgi:hypothetical protein
MAEHNLRVPRPERVLPDFLVIGAQRAGTTLLHTVLAAHPEVYLPGQRKEIHFFDWYFGRGPEWYRRFFPRVDEAGSYRAIGEATPDYLAAPNAAERIHDLIPQCRLVAVLRNPVDRAYSWYCYLRRGYNERRDFNSFISQDPTALEWGLYAKHLGRYLSLFPRTSLLVLLYEELIQQPVRQLDQVSQFLGLSTGWTDAEQYLRARVNTSTPPRFRAGFGIAHRIGDLLMRYDLNWPVRAAKRMGVRRLFGTSASNPELLPHDRMRLRAYYEADVRSLEVLLGRNLTIWN